MKRSKFSEEQIVYAIRQAEADTPIGDLCRQLGVSEATFYTWKKQYAHLGVSEMRRLPQVEEENQTALRLRIRDLAHPRPRFGSRNATIDHVGSWNGIPITSIGRLGLSAGHATRLYSTGETRGECLH